MKNSEPDPGTVIVAAAVVVYSVILVEIVMYLVATPLFMAGTLLLAVVVALGVGRWFHSILDGAPEVEAPAPKAVKVAAPAPRRAAIRTSARTA